jgi:hypothetical protein
MEGLEELEYGGMERLEDGWNGEFGRWKDWRN